MVGAGDVGDPGDRGEVGALRLVRIGDEHVAVRDVDVHAQAELPAHRVQILRARPRKTARRERHLIADPIDEPAVVRQHVAALEQLSGPRP